jgi:hypothetical protein
MLLDVSKEATENGKLDDFSSSLVDSLTDYFDILDILVLEDLRCLTHPNSTPSQAFDTGHPHQK